MIEPNVAGLPHHMYIGAPWCGFAKEESNYQIPHLNKRFPPLPWGAAAPRLEEHQMQLCAGGLEAAITTEAFVRSK